MSRTGHPDTTKSIPEFVRESIKIPMTKTLSNYVANFYGLLYKPTDVYYHGKLFTKTAYFEIDNSLEVESYRRGYLIDKIYGINGRHHKKLYYNIVGKKIEFTPDGLVEINGRNFRYNKLLQELGIELPKPVPIITRKIRCVWGNTHTHKMQAFKFNGLRYLNTCQQKKNRNDYSMGGGSFFSNGYILPMLLFDGTKFIGRIIIRQTFDRDGKEYMFLDRLYLHKSEGSLSNAKKAVLTAITNMLLLQGYNVAASCISEHDDHNLWFLKELPFKPMTGDKNTIRSGAYKPAFYKGAVRSYYSDSGMKHNYDMDLDLSYDYINDGVSIIDVADYFVNKNALST